MSMGDAAANKSKTAMVLEGGSYRGQFTAGVLDVLMEHGLWTDACFGVSAGTLNGLNYKSRQIGRSNRVNLAFCDDSRMMGARSFAASGSIVGYDFLLNDIQDHLDPFDNEAFLANPMKLYATVTDVVFGTADYPEVADPVLDVDYVRASTSLPVVTPPVEIDGRIYQDGGVADSVPVEHVFEEEGFGRAVVVLTQHRAYVKEPADMVLARARYADYPYFLEALENRHINYNEQREHIWSYEEQGRALVIAPPEPVSVGHIERDAEKLLALYIEGRKEAKRRLNEIEDFLQRA